MPSALPSTMLHAADCPACPPCFNCHLPAFSCSHFAECSPFDGNCECPPGFGGNDCTSPLCNSLADGARRVPRPPDSRSCECSAGWSGINCNVCELDDVCSPLVPGGEGAVCYQGIRAIKEQYLMCDVTNTPIQKQLPPDQPPQVTVTYNATSGQGTFQFWAGEKESFYCQLLDCETTQADSYYSNSTQYDCAQVRCQCMPGRLLCGEDGSIDITDFLSEEVKGPGKFKCTEREGVAGRTCSFEEPAMNELITDFFGDPYITLSCTSGSCLHQSQLPGYIIPEPSKFGRAFMIASMVAAFAVVLVVIGGVLLVSRYQDLRAKRKKINNQYEQLLASLLGEGGGSQLSSSEEEELRRALMMAGHKSMSVSWKGVSYYVQPNKRARNNGASTGSRSENAGVGMLSWLRRGTNHPLTNNGPIALPDGDDDDEPSEAVTMEHSLQERLIDDRGHLTILDGISGCVGAGEICAIMGGSGAGKTTFLDILARRHKSGVVTGEILVNGASMPLEEYKRSIGFVDQEDTLIETLTVRETITYSALLRLPRDMSNEAKQFRVRETMVELGILNIADRRIGGAGNRGISGGEKRRVSIACELVTSPSILYLDEPTSGLDSFNAYNVIECLVTLARNYRRTVILTIHQPRSNIYALFDKLVLLARGKLVYSGPAQDSAIKHFSRLGFQCPVGFNMADYFVDLTMHVMAVDSTTPRTPVDHSDDSGMTSTFPGNSSVDQTTNTSLPRSVKAIQDERLFTPHQERDLSQGITQGSSSESLDPDGRSSSQNGVKSASPAVKRRGDGFLNDWKATTDHLAYLVDGFKASEAFRSLERAIAVEVSASRGHNPPHVAESNWGMPEILEDRDSSEFRGVDWKKRATWWTQFTILSGRTFKNMYRNPNLLLGHYAVTLLVAILCGALFWQVSNDLAGFQNRLGFFFFVCALFGFSCMSSIQVFAAERIIFLRERANRYYSPITYFAAKVLFDIVPLRVLPPLTLGLIVYPMIGLRSESLVYLLKFLLVLILFNLTSASVCLAIGIIVPEIGLSNLVSTLVMLFAMLYGGLLLNKATVPAYLGWLRNLSFFNFAVEALIVNEVNGLTLVEDKFGLKINVPGATILETFAFNALGYWGDVIKLGAYWCLMMILGFLWLQFRVKEKR
ncbi:hypothetical protein M427DRAFT_73054 [Gonapodya prolifera JEL478]|uniref:ABC transporter domain-containing protein n=1 Tax=Gonapodya prolifera (strain JEL478) TaxID=1344416 RepID=A0A139A3Z5_GONPJ|nr:hypothetical protein M427DRAFT_73054 [Gonapodya prolifera JEL478]|eukprot:KXS11308.1 hypothetical protein M427DRAFT_73054 [Gonapodya prolifera JEL478]